MRRQGVVACAACANTKRLTLHHAVYDRLGYERFSDVVLLCHRCHHDVHMIARRNGKLSAAHHRLRKRRSVYGLGTGPLS
jgi:5-methylcytosine-specific restriction endonuclease McrA